MKQGGASRSLRRTATRRGKTTTATARALNLGRRGPAGLADPVSAPTRFAEFIKQGICPWCGRGPFDVLALHTNRAHAIDRKELREVAGLFYSESLSSPSYHQRKVALAKRQWAEGRTGIAPGASRGVKRNLSPAAVELQAKKARVMTGEQRAELGRRESERRLAETAERDTAILNELSRGGMYIDVARKYGVHPKTVATIAKRNGLESDGRARYAAKIGRLPGQAESLAAGRASRITKLQERNTAIVAAWQAGTPIREMATQFGLSLKAMRTRLKALDQTIPDGRADPLRQPVRRPPKPVRYCSVDGCRGVHRARGLCSAHYQQAKKRSW